MKVLVVEDQKKIADSIKKGLEINKITTDIAYEGQAGYDLAASGDYDVIVLDIMLPNLNGIDLCKKLREEKNLVPVLMLTAKGTLEDKVSGLNCGADDYLIKPFEFEELIARIKALSRRPNNLSSPILIKNNLKMDTNTQKVYLKENPVNLSKKEYLLLEYLLNNKGLIVSKAQIISKVWEYDTDILPNTVEAHIKKLRMKVGSNIIRTIRGFGYTID